MLLALTADEEKPLLEATFKPVLNIVWLWTEVSKFEKFAHLIGGAKCRAPTSYDVWCDRTGFAEKPGGGNGPPGGGNKPGTGTRAATAQLNRPPLPPAISAAWWPPGSTQVPGCEPRVAIVPPSAASNRKPENSFLSTNTTMAIAPITGTLKKKIITDITIAFGTGFLLATGYWQFEHRPLVEKRNAFYAKQAAEKEAEDSI